VSGEWRAQVRDASSEVLVTLTSTRSLRQVRAAAEAAVPRYPRAREVALHERVGPGWAHLETLPVGGSGA